MYTHVIYVRACLSNVQLLNVKKFLQKIHSGGAGKTTVDSTPRLLLPPDLFLECEDIILQITDDLFEVKLKANYEVCVCVCALWKYPTDVLYVCMYSNKAHFYCMVYVHS